MYIGVLSLDNSNNGNICNATCPTNKGKFLKYKMKFNNYY